MPMNMSYCRFENTLKALQKCAEALADIDYDLNELSSDENYAARQLLRLCQQITGDFGREPS